MEQVEGKVIYKRDESELDGDQILKEIGLVGPYLELPEDLTLSELIDFQLKTSPNSGGREGYQKRMIYFDMMDYQHRFVSQFSTGMKQKARLILCLTENRNVWILDEPGSNLDPESSRRLWDFVKENLEDRLLIVASNDPNELAMADFAIDL